jgi:hypothetical protein
LKPHALGLGQETYVTLAIGVHPGLIRHEPHDSAPELRPVLCLEHIESRPDLDTGNRVGARGCDGLSLAFLRLGHGIEGEKPGAHDGAHAPAQLDDGALARRVDPVR